MWQWYFPTATDVTISVWKVWESPSPCGPWTLINTTNWNGRGYYNPVPLHRSLAGVTANGTPLTLLFSGNYTTSGPSGFYHLYTTTVVVNTH